MYQYYKYRNQYRASPSWSLRTVKRRQCMKSWNHRTLTEYRHSHVSSFIVFQGQRGKCEALRKLGNNKIKPDQLCRLRYCFNHAWFTVRFCWLSGWKSVLAVTFFQFFGRRTYIVACPKTSRTSLSSKLNWKIDIKTGIEMKRYPNFCLHFRAWCSSSPHYIGEIENGQLIFIFFSCNAVYDSCIRHL